VDKGLKAGTFQKLLEASYSGMNEVEGFILDKKNSTKNIKNMRSSIRTSSCSA
jgi:hypothetical protein